MSRSKLTRRGALAAAASLGAAAAMVRLSAAARAADAAQPDYIDAHVHVWSPDVERWPLAEGYSKADMLPPSFTPDELLAHARPVGVRRIVLIQMSFYRFDNRYMLQAMADHPGTFGGVGIVDHTAPHPERAMAALAKQGVRGFRIVAGQSDPFNWLEHPGYHAMWRYAADEGLAICPLINPQYLPAVERMAQSYPAARVVIDHFARIGIDGEIRTAELDRLCSLARHPQTFVKVSAFYALGSKAMPYDDLGPMIRRVYQAFGPERLMWATDCPFQVQGGHTYEASLALVRDRLDWLTAADKQWLLRKTAERVFFG